MDKSNKKNDFKVINPSNENSFAVISLGTSEDVNNAVFRKKAFSTWCQIEKKERINLLEKLLKIYNNRWDEISKTMSDEMGAPIDWSSSAQTGSGADHIKDFIKRLKKFEFEKKFDDNSNNYIVYEPIGVCGLITPWNWPINQITLKVIPALATGCTMILKPSEIAPLSGYAFCRNY